MDAQGTKLNKRRSYIKQQNKGDNKTFKHVHEETFLRHKTELANKTAKKESIVQYAVFKNGERIKVFDNRYDADSYISSNATDAELKQDHEVKRMGSTRRYNKKEGKNIVIDKPIWEKQQLENKIVITNMNEVNEIMSTKDQEKFYTEIKPKYER